MNEIKVDNVKEIVEIVKRLNHYEKNIFISFSDVNIINLKQLYPDSKCKF
jgi:hypothetical protein